MFRNGFPNNAKEIESRNANDLPLPFEPHTKVVAFLPSSISVNVLPKEPKFLKRTVLKLINLDSPYKVHEQYSSVLLCFLLPYRQSLY